MDRPKRNVSPTRSTNTRRGNHVGGGNATGSGITGGKSDGVSVEERCGDPSSPVSRTRAGRSRRGSATSPPRKVRRASSNTPTRRRGSMSWRRSAADAAEIVRIAMDTTSAGKKKADGDDIPARGAIGAKEPAADVRPSEMLLHRIGMPLPRDYKEIFLKPFDYEWRRLLVKRNQRNSDAANKNSKTVADAYYYAPCGKKLRSTVEVQAYLLAHPNPDLSVECFTYLRRPIAGGIAPYEILCQAGETPRYHSLMATNENCMAGIDMRVSSSDRRKSCEATDRGSVATDCRVADGGSASRRKRDYSRIEDQSLDDDGGESQAADDGRTGSRARGDSWSRTHMLSPDRRTGRNSRVSDDAGGSSMDSQEAGDGCRIDSQTLSEGCMMDSRRASDDRGTLHDESAEAKNEWSVTELARNGAPKIGSPMNRQRAEEEVRLHLSPRRPAYASAMPVLQPRLPALPRRAYTCSAMPVLQPCISAVYRPRTTDSARRRLRVVHDTSPGSVLDSASNASSAKCDSGDDIDYQAAAEIAGEQSQSKPDDEMPLGSSYLKCASCRVYLKPYPAREEDSMPEDTIPVVYCEVCFRLRNDLVKEPVFLNVEQARAAVKRAVDEGATCDKMDLPYCPPSIGFGDSTKRLLAAVKGSAKSFGRMITTRYAAPVPFVRPKHPIQIVIDEQRLTIQPEHIFIRDGRLAVFSPYVQPVATAARRTSGVQASEHVCIEPDCEPVQDS